jgi:hypothetical protein
MRKLSRPILSHARPFAVAWGLGELQPERSSAARATGMGFWWGLSIFVVLMRHGYGMGIEGVFLLINVLRHSLEENHYRDWD